MGNLQCPRHGLKPSDLWAYFDYVYDDDDMDGVSTTTWGEEASLEAPLTRADKRRTDALEAFFNRQDRIECERRMAQEARDRYWSEYWALKKRQSEIEQRAFAARIAEEVRRIERERVRRMKLLAALGEVRGMAPKAGEMFRYNNFDNPKDRLNGIVAVSEGECTSDASIFHVVLFTHEGRQYAGNIFYCHRLPHD